MSVQETPTAESVARPLPPEPDFDLLADRFQQVLTEHIHQPGGMTLRGNDLYAEALRRTLLSGGSGFIPSRDAMNTLNAHTVVDKMNVASLEKRNRELWQANVRLQATAARDCASMLRGWLNQVRVPSRLRREGVLIAADLLDQCATNVLGKDA